MINQLFNEDNMETMAKMPNSFINGIITSPPYNLWEQEQQPDLA